MYRWYRLLRVHVFARYEISKRVTINPENIGIGKTTQKYEIKIVQNENVDNHVFLIL